MRKTKLKMKYLIALSLLLAITVFSYPYNWLLEKRLRDYGHEKIIDTFDQLDFSKSGEGKMGSLLKDLKAKRIYRREHGYYIILDQFMVESEGLFILDEESSFSPSQGTDPSYRKIDERLYWFQEKG